MTTQVTVGRATVTVHPMEMTNGVGVTSQDYDMALDELLHACQRVISSAKPDCPHVQSMLSNARKHLAEYARRTCT